MDVCVMSNVLSFVQAYDLTWSKADSASLDLIISSLNNKDHINNPVMIAPYYGGTSIILYHLARLMSIKPIPALERRKNSLVNDAIRQLEQTKSELEKIILSNALMKWNSNALVPSVITNEIEKSDLPFFVGNIPSIFPAAFQKPFAKKGIAVYYHYCPAYNNVLLLEYLVLKNESTSSFATRLPAGTVGSKEKTE